MSKKWTIAELFIPVLAVVFSIYYLISIQGIQKIAQTYGTILSIIIFILSAFLFFFAFKNFDIDGMEKIKNIFKEKEVIKKYLKPLVLMGSVLIYILVLPYLGYPVTNFIFLSSIMFYLGMKKITHVLGISLLITVLGFGLFIAFLRVNLPLDPLSNIILKLIH